MICRFMLQIYKPIVMMTHLKCFVIALKAIRYVINNVGAVEFSTYIFGWSFLLQINFISMKITCLFKIIIICS
jgi:hypothetical protein